MVNLAELPSELLDLIVYGELYTYTQVHILTRVPPIHYARKLDDKLRWIANLTQVNQKLRRHFMARLWAKIDLCHVKDIYLVDKFLSTHDDVYGPLIEHVLFSWEDPLRGSELGGEVYMNSHNDHHGGFGRMQDWLFQDRWELIKKVELPEYRERYPDRTDEDLLEMMYPSWDGLSQITEGPDGWGNVPGFSSPNDVADGLVRISSRASNLKILDYNERYIPVPPMLLSNLLKLEKVTLYSDMNHQDVRDSALLELPNSVRHMDIMYIFCAVPHKTSDGRREPASFLSLRREGLGVACIDTDEKTDEQERRLRLTCAAIIKGLTEGSLQSVKVWDPEMLRIAEMLPCWIALDLPNKGEKDLNSEWGYETMKVFTDYGRKPPVLFDSTAVVELKSMIQGCGSASDVQKRCRVQQENASGEAADEEIFTAEILASWLADDEDLCHAVYQGLRWTRT